MAKRKNTGLGIAQLGVRETETKSFTPILPTQVGILLELLDRKYGITDRAPIRDKIIDILLQLPLGGPTVSDEVVQLLDALAEADASSNRRDAFIGVGVDELQRRVGSKPKTGPKRKDTPALKQQKKNLSKAFKEANSKLRKKNGQLKKGKTQSDVAKTAHRLARKMPSTKKPAKRASGRKLSSAKKGRR